jgi:hypothetical protein
LQALQQTLTERKLAYWAEQTAIQAKVATAWALPAEGKHDETPAAMRAAADHEGQTEKHVVVPGDRLCQPASSWVTYAWNSASDRARAKRHVETLVASASPSDGGRAEPAHAKQGSCSSGVPQVAVSRGDDLEPSLERALTHRQRARSQA